MTIIKSIRFVWGLFDRKFKQRFLLVLFALIAISIIDVFGLAVFIPIISIVSDPEALQTGVVGEFYTWTKLSNQNFVLVLFLVAFAFFILRAVVVIAGQWLMNRFSFSVNEAISVEKYQHYLNGSWRDLMNRDSAEIIRELTINPGHFARFIVMALLTIFSETVMLLVVVIGIAAFEFNVFILLILTLLPTAVIFNRGVKNRVKKIGVEINSLTPRMYANAQRAIRGYVDVKLRQKEQPLREDYQHVVNQINQRNIRLGVMQIIPAKLFEIVTVVGLIIIYIYATLISEDAALMLPLITIYALAGYRAIPSLSRITPAIMMLDQYHYLFDIFSGLKFKEHNLKLSKGVERLAFKYVISISNLSFSYDKTKVECVIDDLSMSIQRGDCIGLIGASGSGKSTLAKLITGFEESNEGVITIDGVILTQDYLSSWQKNISYIQQDPYLEEGSMASNIAFLEDVIDQERLKAAIALAMLDSVLQGVSPEQFIIEEGGKNLSGGQKQRIVIARAFYYDASLIVMDEATSALDVETEKGIGLAIDNLNKAGKTLLIIAHRYSTLAHCNRIIEMKNGKIERELTYNELKLKD